MTPTVDHRRVVEVQLADAWRAYRLACEQGRWSAATFTMARIDGFLDRLLAMRR